MTSRAANRAALLGRVDTDLKKLEADYNASLYAKQVAADLRIDIKNVFENLRSVLDYLAQDIRAKYCPAAKAGDRFYFPVLPDRAQFESRMRQWYPGLDSNNKALWDFLESVQPYHVRYEWLGHFNKVNNENKHSDLVEQTRVEVEQVKATMQGGSSVSWNPGSVRFGAGVFIGGVPVDPRTQMPVPHPSLKVERNTWVDFQFAGVGVSALGLVKDSAAGIRSIVESVQPHL